MCGIGGLLSAEINDREFEHFGDVMAAMKHRGPDDSDVYCDGNVMLGHNRLTILDLSALGRQPMQDEARMVALVFNGEIYNFRELRAVLESKGHSFSSSSDTEVIIHAYLEYGEECVAALDGMFAFALWDRRKQQLFMARDRIGEKPLFYYVDKGKFAFASELTALLQWPFVSRRINWAVIPQYLTTQYVPGISTIVEGAKCLKPGHRLTVRLVDGELLHDEYGYWALPVIESCECTDMMVSDAVEELLVDSVRRRLVADVDVGVLLSGGLDSSLITAIATKFKPGLKTFAVTFQDESLNEKPFSDMIARTFGTEHHVLPAEDLTPEVMCRVVDYMDQPLGDPAAVPTFMIAEQAARYVKVALSGEGADELFGGYPHYQHEARLAPYFPLLSLLGPMLDSVRCLSGGAVSSCALWRRLVRVACSERDEGSSRWTKVFTPSDMNFYCTDTLRNTLRNVDCTGFIKDAMRANSGLDWLNRCMVADMQTWLVDDLLVKVDRMTMAHGLEARTPFLDYRLLEKVAAMGSGYKVGRHRLKILLKQIAGRYLTPEIIHRPKHGFEVPVDRMLLGPLRSLAEPVFMSGSTADSFPFRTDILAGEWKYLERNGRSRYPRLIWVMFVLLFWMDRHAMRA